MARKKKDAEQVSEEILEEAVSEQENTDETVEMQAESESEAADNTENQGQTADAENASVGVVTSAVNFRTGASFNKAVIAELKQGAHVKVMSTEQGENGVWYKCEYQGKTGYIKATGIKFEQ